MNRTEQPSLPQSAAIKSSRIEGFDVARSFAFIGMVFVNFKVVMLNSSAPESLGGKLIGLLEGRASATFIMLAGIGITLMSRRAFDSGEIGEIKIIQRTIQRRALFLFIAGLIYYPIFIGDILHYYGVYLAIGSLMLGVRFRHLWGTIILVNILFLSLVFTIEYGTRWNWETFEYQGFWTPSGFISNLIYDGIHPVFPWISFLLVGIWFARLDFRSEKTQYKLFLGALFVAIASELISLFLNHNIGPGNDIKYLITAEPIPPNPFYIVAASSEALAFISFVLIVSHRLPSVILKPFVYTGQITLTLYIAHVIVGMGILQFFDRLENQPIEFIVLSASTMCLVSIVFATIWRSRFSRGPLELLMRRICR